MLPDDEGGGRAHQPDRDAHNSASSHQPPDDTPDVEDVTADEHAAKALRTIGRAVGVHHVGEGIGALIDEWLGGAA